MRLTQNFNISIALYTFAAVDIFIIIDMICIQIYKHNFNVYEGPTLFKKQVLSLDNNYCFIAQWYDTRACISEKSIWNSFNFQK